MTPVSKKERQVMSDESPEITPAPEETPADSTDISAVVNIPASAPEAEGESAPEAPETPVEPEPTPAPVADGLPTADDLDAVAAEQAAAEATAPVSEAPTPDPEPTPIAAQPLTLADVHTTLVAKLEAELEDAKAGIAHLKSGINAPDISHIVDLVSAQFDGVVANIESALAEFKANSGE